MRLVSDDLETPSGITSKLYVFGRAEKQESVCPFCRSSLRRTVYREIFHSTTLFFPSQFLMLQPYFKIKFFFTSIIIPAIPHHDKVENKLRLINADL